MSTSNQELIQLIEATGLNINQPEVQKFLRESAGSLQDSEEFIYEIIEFLSDHGREISFDWEETAESISEAFNEILVQFSAELKFTEEEEEKSEEVYGWYGEDDVLEIIQDRLSVFNLEVVEYDTEEDSIGFILFLKDKFQLIKDHELVKLMDINRY